MEINTQLPPLDQDQKLVLAVYDLYSNQQEHTYLQYTAICALIFHLIQKGVFTYPDDELLVYDYKEQRRYIWEAKKFMADINILRDHGYLLRARSRSKTSRDVNAHQCTTAGHEFLKKERGKSDADFNAKHKLMLNELTCPNGKPKQLFLADHGPELRCGTARETIKGFLKDFDPTQASEPNSSQPNYTPFFL